MNTVNKINKSNIKHQRPKHLQQKAQWSVLVCPNHFQNDKRSNQSLLVELPR